MLWPQDQGGAKSVYVSIRPMRRSCRDLSVGPGAHGNLLRGQLQLRLASEIWETVLATGATLWDVIEWILRLSSSAPIPSVSPWPFPSGIASTAVSWLHTIFLLNSSRHTYAP